MTRPEDIPTDVWDAAREPLRGTDAQFPDHDCYARAIERIARAILAERGRAARVRVKELEWYNGHGAMADIQFEGVATVGNNYLVTRLSHPQHGDEWYVLDRLYPSPAAAKAAAQADYEARIMSALVQPEGQLRPS